MHDLAVRAENEETPARKAAAFHQALYGRRSAKDSRRLPLALEQELFHLQLDTGWPLPDCGRWLWAWYDSQARPGANPSQALWNTVQRLQALATGVRKDLVWDGKAIPPDLLGFLTAVLEAAKIKHPSYANSPSKFQDLERFERSFIVQLRDRDRPLPEDEVERLYDLIRDAEHALALPGQAARLARLAWERNQQWLRRSTATSAQPDFNPELALDRNPAAGFPADTDTRPALPDGRENAAESPPSASSAPRPPRAPPVDNFGDNDADHEMVDPIARAYEITESIVGRYRNSVHVPPPAPPGPHFLGGVRRRP